MSWDTTSILFDNRRVKGIIRLDTDNLDISFSDWTKLSNLYPKNLDCKSSTPGLLECQYDSNKAGDFSIHPDANYCCQHRSPSCCNSKGGFNIDCPDDSHIVFQKMVSQPSKTECETPSSGGFPVCTTTAKSSCYKACGKMNCQSTCSMGKATAECIENIQNPTPTCLSTCLDVKDCDVSSCFSNEGKCGTGNLWQSSGNLDNLSQGWIMCEFYYNFSSYDRSSQSHLVNWIFDLYQYQTTSKPSLPQSFSIPMILHAIALQTSTIFYNEIYSHVDTAFSPITYLSNPNAISSYIQNILLPISTPLKQLTLSNYTNLSSFFNVISNEMKLPTFSPTSGTISLRLHPSQFSNLPNDSSTTLSQFVTNFLREHKTSLFTIVEDGSSPSKPMHTPLSSLINPKVMHIIGIDTTTVSRTNLFSWLFGTASDEDTKQFISSIRTFCYDERYSIPSTTFIFAYEIVCQVQQYSPMLMAYISSTSSINSDTAQKMYKDTNLYPYTYAVNNLTDKERDEECRKQLRNDSMAQTVNTLGRLVYGYYSPDCKCIISNIAPIGQPQFNNKISMCFDYNCNSKDMSNRYKLTKDECVSNENCQQIREWGDFIQNSQNFDVDKFNNECDTKRIPRKYLIDYPIIVLTIIITLIFTFIIFKVPFRHKSLQLSIFILSLLIFIGFSLFLSIDMKGIPVCEQSSDGNLQTVCKSQLSDIHIPMLYCQDRYKWCDCMFNSEDCICKSGILVPPSGEVRIEETFVYEWNAVYGTYVVILGMTIIFTLLLYTRQKTILFWAVIIIIFLSIIISQYLCVTKYSNYKNYSTCTL